MASYDAAVPIHVDATSHGVSWKAVIAGAFVGAAVWLIMLALGAGLELSTISPFSARDASATVGTIALIWIIVTQIVASSLGGYLTGRLRTRWQAIHNDEVHFRDTANGLVAWAVSVVVAAAFLGAAAGSLAGRVAAARQTDAEQTGTQVENSYVIDKLFRSNRPAPENDLAARAEAGRIISHDLRSAADSQADAQYLSQLVESKTGLNAADASKRVSDVMMEARETADNARKTMARVLLWTFLALLIGAFCASFAATMGGRQRDRVETI